MVSADEIIEFVSTTADAEVMVPRRLGKIEEVVVPVKVTVVHVFSVFLDNPRTCGIFSLVITPAPEFAIVFTVVQCVRASVIRTGELIHDKC